jgi:hypothetical protein
MIFILKKKDKKINVSTDKMVLDLKAGVFMRKTVIKITSCVFFFGILFLAVHGQSIRAGTLL